MDKSTVIGGTKKLNHAPRTNFGNLTGSSIIFDILEIKLRRTSAYKMTNGEIIKMDNGFFLVQVKHTISETNNCRWFLRFLFAYNYMYICFCHKKVPMVG